jgi:hypothetical protein
MSLRPVTVIEAVPTATQDCGAMQETPVNELQLRHGLAG